MKWCFLNILFWFHFDKKKHITIHNLQNKNEEKKSPKSRNVSMVSAFDFFKKKCQFEVSVASLWLSCIKYKKVHDLNAFLGVCSLCDGSSFAVIYDTHGNTTKCLCYFIAHSFSDLVKIANLKNYTYFFSNLFHLRHLKTETKATH